MNKLIDSDRGITVLYAAKRCRCCVISAAFPGADIDESGLCRFCREEPAETATSAQDWPALASEIIAGADSARTHDILVLFSGGKDSTLALQTLRTKYNYRVLAFTLDNGFVSDQARRNIEATTTVLQVEHLYYKPEPALMAKIYKDSIAGYFGEESKKYSTSACGSCISMVLYSAGLEARRRKIPLLAGGWTPGQLTPDALVSGHFLASICRRHFLPLADTVTELAHVADRFKKTDQESILPPLFNPLYCSRYDEDEILDELSRIGWSAPQDTDSCSTNCKLNGFLVAEHIQRHGFHPYEFELAYHVRTHQMARDAAISKMTNLKVGGYGINAIAASLGIERVQVESERSGE